ncbi:PKD-like family lipoprotein [Chitinophaga horti]|uniref:PKD-like family lipoprotein n=1 Tax=Chitinophaga horti TaxID=2920382 RepID=A0ABY6J6E8_9BACT|nr:PKD-like family lipoprotein [Chitinophaga horti]UYQ94177.1 PKD-like family lipoprotein [Chitinophaga horti]
MKVTVYIGLCLAMLVAFGSCSKDRGNYDYIQLDSINIDVSDLAASYSMLRFDTLKLNPVVTYKGEVVNPAAPQFEELSFAWEMYPSSLNPSILEKYTLDSTIGLKAIMDKKEAIWELLFTVTNTKTKIKAFAKFAVAITPSLAEGWMVLYERNGHTDVGMIVNNEISKTAVTSERVLLDIYSNSNNAPMAGTPGSIIYSLVNLTGAHKLYIQSGGEAVSVNPSTFERIDNFESIFWTTPAVKAPQLVHVTERRKEFMINNNRLHVIDYTILGNGRRAFEDALTGNYGSLAPWMATTSGAAFDAVLYDQTNKKFMKVVARGNELIPFTTVQNPTAAFDVNNVGMTFKFADLGWNYWEHFIMADAAGKHFLLTADFRTGEIATIGKGKYDMSNSPEIADAVAMATGYYGEVCYYSSPSSLYQFRYTAGITDKLWTVPAGEKITNISLQKYYNTNPASGRFYDPKNICKILYIATYNEQTQTGSVYQMQVNQSSGAIIPDTQKRYTGFGKIKEMAWKPFIIL